MEIHAETVLLPDVYIGLATAMVAAAPEVVWKWVFRTRSSTRGVE